jgi:hypothetical protein
MIRIALTTLLISFSDALKCRIQFLEEHFIGWKSLFKHVNGALSINFSTLKSLKIHLNAMKRLSKISTHKIN